MEAKNISTFVKQFNDEFGSSLKDSFQETPMLVKMFDDYIEQTFKASPIYSKIINKILGIEDKLKNSFTDEQKELFDKWETYQEELNTYTMEHSFIYGVCLDKELSIEKENYNKGVENHE